MKKSFWLAGALFALGTEFVHATNPRVGRAFPSLRFERA